MICCTQQIPNASKTHMRLKPRATCRDTAGFSPTREFGVDAHGAACLRREGAAPYTPLPPREAADGAAEPPVAAP